ncbi:MAG: hypothetical protein IPM53_04055 [Anaerolineaceae bacterium]|nr:hypothetical protein [Anaerolineaceae bacterium]
MKMRKNNSVSGLFLVALGLIFLAGQFVTFDLSESLGLLVVPTLGALFLVWGILTRNSGLMIPGGILSGIGWGAYAIEGPFAIWQGDSEGGVFLIFLGLGFGLITLVTAVFTNKTHWWALIPGSIIAFVGLAVLFGGALLTLLTWVGKLWPLALILLGISLLLNANKNKSEKEKLV